MRTLADLIAAAPSISARPESVATLIEVIDDPVVGADKLVPIVERDPGLTASLLKLCNSALYGAQRTIASPREALVMVGNLMFMRLCFTLSLKPVIRRDLAGYGLDVDTLWQHSLATAYGAAYLMVGMGAGELRDRAFTAGLLHDLGKLVLDAEIAANLNGADLGRDLTLHDERCLTGFDHAEVGAALLESWDLPEAMIDAVRWHHDPFHVGANQRLVLAVNVANRVSHMAGKLQTGSEAVERWVTTTFDGVGFSLPSIRELTDTLARRRVNVLALAINPRL